MEIVIDASALLAVILNEPEKSRVVSAVAGCTLAAPGSLPWEIGNAFSAMLRRQRLHVEKAQRGLAVFASIPISLFDVELSRALRIAAQTNMYAYDAYYLACAVSRNAPLLTLDKQLRSAAQEVEADLLELE